VKYEELGIAFLLVVALVVGIVASNETPATAANHSFAAASYRVAAVPGGNAAPAMRKGTPDYPFAQKSEFIDDMEKELGVIHDELDLAGDKVDRIGGEAKADAKVRLQAVREKWAQTEKKLNQAENATDTTWRGVKGDVEKSVDDTRDSFEKTRQWVNDTIKP